MLGWHGCQVGSNYTHKPVPEGKIPGEFPWHTLSVDIMGLFPTVSGHRFVITFLDVFTGYCVLVTSADHTVANVAHALMDRVVSYFGTPVRILSSRSSWGPSGAAWRSGWAAR